MVIIPFGLLCRPDSFGAEFIRFMPENTAPKLFLLGMPYRSLVRLVLNKRIKPNENKQRGSHPVINRHHLTLLVAYSGALHSQKLKKKIKIVDEKSRSPSPVQI